MIIDPTLRLDSGVLKVYSCTNLQYDVAYGAYSITLRRWTTCVSVPLVFEPFRVGRTL